MLARCRRLCQHWAMTQRSALRQKDIERLIKAAENTGAVIQVDLKTLVATIFPGGAGTMSLQQLRQDDEVVAKLPDDYAF